MLCGFLGSNGVFFWSFFYVCPEPVLVKCSPLYLNGSKRRGFGCHLVGNNRIFAKTGSGQREAALERRKRVTSGCASMIAVRSLREQCSFLSAFPVCLSRACLG
eukprot:COSAG06_NODE_20490_length_793_cov_5.110951_1_plen_103_part_01